MLECSGCPFTCLHIVSVVPSMSDRDLPRVAPYHHKYLHTAPIWIRVRVRVTVTVRVRVRVGITVRVRVRVRVSTLHLDMIVTPP